MRGWASRTPPEFTSTCKLPREITHERRFVAFRSARPFVLQCAVELASLRWMGPDRAIVDYLRLQADRSAELDAWSRMIPVLQAPVRYTGL